MSNYNRFGAVYGSVVALYPKTVAADFDPAATGTSNGGQAEIESALDRISREVASAVRPDVFTQMTQVHAEELVRNATDGQTTATLGLLPATTGTVHLWVYPSLLAMTATPGMGFDSTSYYWSEPAFGIGEVASGSFTVDVSTGAISLTTGMSLGQRLYGSYDVNIAGATFSMPSLADIVTMGSAALLGQRLYTEATQKWDLVTTYQAKYDAAIAALRDGTLIPDELRRLNYWTEIERAAQGSWGGVKLSRA